MTDNSPQNDKDWRQSEIAGDQIGERLQTISILTRELEKKLGESLGVNLTDLAAMEHLITSGDMTPSELASRLNVSTAASTQIIDRLERAGHVSRERQSDDRRKVLVVPKAASVARTFQDLAPMLNGLDAAVAALSDADRHVIERFLDRVIDAYHVAVGLNNGTASLSQRHSPLPRTSAKSRPFAVPVPVAPQTPSADLDDQMHDGV